MNDRTGPGVLVGFSGSPASRLALRWAAGEARRRRTRLRIVRAWEACPALAPYSAVHDSRTRHQRMTAAAAQLSADVRRELGEPPASEVVTELAEGTAERVLVAVSAGADLLVLGDHAEPGSAGPVLRTCLGRAHCPVVVVGPAAALPGEARDRRLTATDTVTF